MTSHGVAEARDRLSELIDRARRGEQCVITRRGRPVVESRAIARQAKPVTDAAKLVSRLRDEWER